MTKSTKWHVLGSLAIHWVHIEESDQTGWMSRLICVFAWRIYFAISKRDVVIDVIPNVTKRIQVIRVIMLSTSWLLYLWMMLFHSQTRCHMIVVEKFHKNKIHSYSTIIDMFFRRFQRDSPVTIWSILRVFGAQHKKLTSSWTSHRNIRRQI